MVQIDATLKEIISLKQSDSISMDKFKEYLLKFSKEEFIEYLVEEETELEQEEGDSEDAGFEYD